MVDARSALDWDRDVMATLLVTNAQLAADVLAADTGGSSGQVMRAIAATRSLEMIVDDTLHALVDQARDAGHTWAEIGELLHTSRQAAFQRFGGARAARSDDSIAVPPAGVAAGAVEAAVPVLRAFLDGRFDEVRAMFGARMLDACSVELLADVREKVRRHGGEVQALGAPVLSVRDGLAAVDVPVALEHADGVGRVVLDAERRVVGFFVRPTNAST